MTTCGTCAGLGFDDKVCPECKLDIHVVNTQPRQDISKIASHLEKGVIPKAYKGVNWNSQMFWASRSAMRGNRLVEQFVSQLDKVHSIFMQERIPDRSAIFIAPSNYSKMTWVYSCMQYALKAGFTVAPVLDTSEIKRLFVLSTEKPTTKVGDVDYDDYISADVLFFTVIKNEYHMNAFSTILDLIDKRNRRGLITLGISRYSVHAISKWDYNKDFTSIMVRHPDENPIKQPAIIQCL